MAEEISIEELQEIADVEARAAEASQELRAAVVE